MYENTHYRDLQEAFQAGYRKAIKEQLGGGPMAHGQQLQRAANIFVSPNEILVGKQTKKKLPTQYPCPEGATWNWNGWAGAGCYADGYRFDPNTGLFWTCSAGVCYYFSCEYIDGEHVCTQIEAPCPPFISC